jgi:hypothetical protein
MSQKTLFELPENNTLKSTGNGGWLQVITLIAAPQTCCPVIGLLRRPGKKPLNEVKS